MPESTPICTFDEALHEYRIDGRVVPSVTQCLRYIDSFDGVPADVLEAAREFGSHVHAACDLDNRGALDEESLDPHLAEYLAGWRKFLHESKGRVVQSEQIVFSPRLLYAGTLDAVVNINGRDTLVDIKSGAIPRSVGPQTAAYAEALRETTGQKISARLCVQLLANDYRTKPLKDPADWSVFVSCLNLTKWESK